MPSNHLLLCCPLLFLLQSLPASGSFPVSQLFTPRGQSIGALASASVLPMNIQGCFPLGLTGLISLLSRDFQDSSPAPQFEGINSLALCLHSSALTTVHDHWEDHSLDYTDVCWQSNLVSAFQTLSRVVIALLPRSNRFVIS